MYIIFIYLFIFTKLKLTFISKLAELHYSLSKYPLITAEVPTEGTCIPVGFFSPKYFSGIFAFS